MVPYCNRIKNGHLRFDGLDFDVGRTHPWPDACHGHGLLAPWTIVGRSANTLSIVYGHAGGDWPAPYRVTQRFALRGRTLEMELSVTNTGDRAMPAGIGFHPYFPGRGGLHLDVEGQLYRPFDPAARPSGGGPKPLRSPPVLSPGEAAFLSGWNGQARIGWAGTGRILEVSASPTLSFCTLFAPAETDALCLEPSSHRVGGLDDVPGAGSSTGVRVLRARNTLSGSMALRCGTDFRGSWPQRPPEGPPSSRTGSR